MYVTTLIEGFDEHARIVRRTVMRYLAMASLIVFQTTSVVVKKRFPTMDHLIEAGGCSSCTFVFFSSVPMQMRRLKSGEQGTKLCTLFFFPFFLFYFF